MAYEAIKCVETIQLETPDGVRESESNFEMETSWLDQQKQN